MVQYQILMVIWGATYRKGRDRIHKVLENAKSSLERFQKKIKKVKSLAGISEGMVKKFAIEEYLHMKIKSSLLLNNTSYV